MFDNINVGDLIISDYIVGLITSIESRSTKFYSVMWLSTGAESNVSYPHETLENFVTKVIRV